jgi:hypothetical protein
MIPAFEREKTFHALDRAVTAIDFVIIIIIIKCTYFIFYRLLTLI